MATVNFSVPDDVKRDFQDAFADENKSAVIARAAAIEALLDLRKRQRPVSGEEIRRARRAGRP